MISYIVVFCVFITPKVSAITCSICGQSNLTAPGECTNQFQYDCTSNPTNGGQPLNPQQPPIGGEQKQQAKILCRTTRTKLGENLFAVIKECVTETEHLNRYPDGKAFGCETIRSNSTFPTTYCVCDQDLCNIRSLDEQLSQPQPAIPSGQAPPPPLGASPPLSQSAVQQSRQPLTVTQPNGTGPVDNQNRPDPRQVILSPQLQNVRGLPPAGPQQPLVPPQPVDEFSVPANPASWDFGQFPPGPTLVQEPSTSFDPAPVRAANSSSPPQANQLSSRGHQPGESAGSGTSQLLVNLNTERVRFLTESPSAGTTNKTPSNSTGKATPQNGFVCMVCGEGNLTQKQDCQVQNPLDCRSLFRPDANLLCFTKAITLPTGQSQIEKRCASEEQLTQELGLLTIQPSCFSGQDGSVRIDYCICGSSKCNQPPLANQANMYPPLTHADRAGTPGPGQERPSPANSANLGPRNKMCYVCGESDQAHPSDCSQQYEYDCSRQYPQGSTILCLTRQTKVASGRYNIEKRCITPAEHQLQYPDNEATLNGCNEAWSGYVQYCVCQGDFCNSQNITLQQQAHNWVQKPTEATEEETFDFEDQSRNVQSTTLPISARQQPQSPVPRLPNGLLVPPSTRLPLAPLQSTSVTLLATKVEKTGGKAAAVNSNLVHETNPPPSSPATTATEVPSPWDNRIRHEGQHRASSTENSPGVEPTKKRGPASSRQSNTNFDDDRDPFRSTSSTTLPGFLNAVALIVLTLVMLH